MTDKIVVFTTCETAEDAERIASSLVEQRLAACVNIVPGLQSIYHWKGALEKNSEFLLMIKTRRGLFDTLEKHLRIVHPYELPEMVAIPFVAGSAGYLNWLDKELKADD